MRSPDHGSWRWWRLAGVVGALALAAAAVNRWIDLRTVHATADRLSGPTVFALLVVLPLVGFPASVAHVAAGLRFGAAMGLALVCASIGLQLIASFVIARHWRGPFERRFGRLRERIPPGAHASVAVLAALLPGVPFAAVNYFLPLAGVRLRTVLLCCWPLDTLRATVTVFLGSESDRFTPRRLVVLGAYALLLAVASSWAYRRLRRRVEAPPEAAGDRTRRG